MKKKNILVALLTLVLIVSTVITPAYAAGGGKNAGRSEKNKSWNQSVQVTAPIEEETSVEDILVEEETLVEKETPVENISMEDETSAGEISDGNEIPTEGSSIEEETTVEENSIETEELAPASETFPEETTVEEPAAYSALSSSVETYASGNSQSRVTLSFDANGGSDAPDSIRGVPGATVTLPDTIPTKDDYSFLGWTTAAVSFPSATYYAIYPAGSEYVLPDSSTTLYAAWQSENVSSSDTNAYFYIRLDGQIPYEPGSYEASAYTTGIQMTNAITVQNWVVDVDTTKGIDGNHVSNDVTDVLSKTPSDELIEQVVEAAGKTYDPTTQYILWYVQKYQALGSSAVDEKGDTIRTSGSGWHIDGVLLDRTKVSISYDANVPAGVTTVPDVPQGYQVVSGTTVTVGESGRVGGSTARQNPSITGYTFMGWNTKADGSGTSYTNGTQFALIENTTLYAIWSKSGNMLQLTKVDGLGNSIDGASFTISDGSTSVNFTAGTYTNKNILTDTVYTVTERESPAHYMGLEQEKFHFIVSSQGGNELTAYLCNEDGDQLTDAPDGVALTYTNSTVNITVTNIGYFYIFHTADVDEGTSVVEVPIVASSDGNWNEDGTYNIVNETTSGYLYGGYYSDYAGKGNYNTPTTVNGNINLTDSVTYKGDQISWDGTKAYTESGLAIHPVAGTTYYLKEVPSTYLLPTQIDTFNRYTNQLYGTYLTTSVDDSNYGESGFVIGTQYNAGAAYDSVTIQPGVNSAYEEKTVGVKDISSNESGYVVMLNYLLLSDGIYTGVGNSNGTKTIKSYWVTPDGVTVTGCKQRLLTVKDTNDDSIITVGGETDTDPVQTTPAEVKYVDTKATIKAIAR